MSEMMACERMHARIPVATCTGRQTKGIVVGEVNFSPIYSIPAECRDCEAGRAALAVAGNPPKIKEELMRKNNKVHAKKPCANCGRAMAIVADGCCFVCYRAGKGKTGENKARALAEVKAKIESGGIKCWKSRPPAGTPKSPPAEKAPRRPAAARATKIEAARERIEKGSAALAKIDAWTGIDLAAEKALFSAPEKPTLAAALESVRAGRKSNVLRPGESGLAATLESVRAEGPSPEAVVNLVFGDQRDLDLYARLLDQSVRCRRSIDQQIFWILQNAIEQEAGIPASG